MVAARELLDRIVAIKVLPPEKVDDAERKRRFVQEAKAASALNHPNIVHIYDIFSADGGDFIAMEYVSGRTLGELIGRKGMKPGDALGYAIQVADALAAELVLMRAVGLPSELPPAALRTSPDELPKLLSDAAQADLSALDPKGDLRDQLGMTFIFSTHDPKVMSHASAVIRIADGQLAGREQLNGGAYRPLSPADWRLILPYLEENERLFSIRIDRDLLTVDGLLRTPSQVYRKVMPRKDAETEAALEGMGG